VYVGQTGHIITARCKKHERHIRLHQPEKSAVIEHCLEIGHKIGFGEASVLVRSAGYINRLVKEAIEIRLYFNHFNRDSRFMLSQEWHPLIDILQKVKQHSDGTGPERTQNRNWRGAKFSDTENGQRPEGVPP
jgi:hypothetical protein